MKTAVMWTATATAFLSAVVAVAAAAYGKPQSPCAIMMCPDGTYCKEVIKLGVRHAECKRDKPGACPVGFGENKGALCFSDCQNDGHCKANEKCCTNACGGLECTDPVGRPSCENVKCGYGQKCELRQVTCVHAPCLPQPICVDIKKPGECPSHSLQDVSICVDNCRVDVDCRGRNKCCLNHCGSRSCQDPTPPKRSCNDMKCGPGEHCVMVDPPCSGHRCPRPTPQCKPCRQKPGVCPSRSLRVFGRSCRPECQNDCQCPGDQRCCATLCGGRCRAPRLTCEDLHCGPGTRCVMDRCYRRGCITRPKCEEQHPSCPAFASVVDRRCRQRDRCGKGSPYSCPRGATCCNTPCGRRCIRSGA